MLLWYDLDQEWRTDAADVADCVDCLKPVFVHADGLGRRDLNLVVVVPGGKTLTDHNAFGCDDLDSGVVMVGAHEDWALERRLEVLWAGIDSSVTLQFRKLRRRHGPADRQGGL